MKIQQVTNFLILERQSEGSVYDEIFTGDHPQLINNTIPPTASRAIPAATDPGANPLLPQTKAEIMGGRIPISHTEAEMPSSLGKCVIGVATAQEINWVK